MNNFNEKKIFRPVRILRRVWIKQAFLKGLGLAGCACFVFAFLGFRADRSRERQTPAVPSRPNIVFILTDDLGIGDIGPYGQTRIATPNLDRMASEGMKFSRHYCGVSVCAPSRASLMTGRHMGHCEIRANRQADPHGQIPLSAQALTVAECLKKSGYTTGIIGKWGLGLEGTSGDPLKQGFDVQYGYLCQVLAHNSFPEFLLRNGRKEMLRNAVTYLPEAHWSKGWGSYATKKVDFSNDLFTREALRFIEQNRRNPFFLYLPYTTPHDNGEAPEGERIETPDLGEYANREGWTPEEKSYAAVISRLDRDIGLIMKQLDDMGLAQNTLVLFSSDNGPAGYGQQRFAENSIFRGKKRDLYEGGLRVPLLARWKGRIAPNTASDHVSAFWDFLPTACELAGVKPPADTDGISYLPALTGKKQRTHPYLYWEIHESGPKLQALLMGRWKAVCKRSGNTKTTELYDLSTDLGECRNVADLNPAVVKQLETLMQQAHRPDPAWPL
jgi:arylsulfatase A